MESQQLEELWLQQRNGDVETPWWADGNYDAAKAQSCNDQGIQCFSSASYAEALSHFTDAVSWDPKKAVFHVNRAAAALKLSRFAEAVRDALNAINRDATNVKAYMKAGAGYERLQEFENAIQMYQRLLVLKPDHKLALHKLDVLHQALQEQESLKLEKEDDWRCGKRPPLSMYPCNEAEAADLLLTAEDMCRLHPNLDQAKCSKVEGLILCQRWQQAHEMLIQLREGYDKTYLEGELLIRKGQVDCAVDILGKCEDCEGAPMKCRNLLRMAEQLQESLHRATEAFKHKSYAECVELCDDAVAHLPARAYSGLMSSVMALKANSFIRQGHFQDALQVLNTSLEMESFVPESLWLRAHVYANLDNVTASFIDLQKLQQLQPQWPGLRQQLGKIASQVVTSRQQSADREGNFTETISKYSVEVEAFATLGVNNNAGRKEIRRAYKKLAGIWHPDKWAKGSHEQRKAAEEKFKTIQEAFSRLTT